MLKKFKNKKQAIIMIISTIILLITETAAIAIIYKNNQENERIEIRDPGRGLCGRRIGQYI